jgi:hypothetical protein
VSTVSAAATLGGLVDLDALEQFGVSKARWPVKSAEHIIDLLKNAEANADGKGLGPAGLGDTELLACKPKIVSRCSTPFINFHPDRRPLRPTPTARVSTPAL